MTEFNHKMSMFVVFVASRTETLPVDRSQDLCCPLVPFADMHPEGRMGVCMADMLDIIMCHCLIRDAQLSPVPADPRDLPTALSVAVLELRSCRIRIYVKLRF